MNTIKRILFILLTISVLAACEDEKSGKTITKNEIGTSGGYGYEFWMEGSVKGSMTLREGGGFDCEWTSTPAAAGGLRGNILFRRGQKFPTTQKHGQIGNIKVDYKSTYTVTNGNISYLCVYGWTRNPLIEYYIVDSWGNSRPPGGWSGASNKGTITVDGDTYDIYVSDRVNQPSIDGTRTFKQYWSVRRNKRTSGTVSVSEHFKKWEEVGMPLGNLYEVAFTIEGYDSSGMASVTENVLTIIK